ncbi:MAG: hypothetical protein ACP5SB_04155 [Caldisericaceae bacterium]
MTLVKRNFIVSGLVGLAISIATRLSLFVFSTDFSYVKIWKFILLPKDNLFFIDWLNAKPEMLNSLGKKVIGAYGFPFSSFARCSLQRSGSFIIPICDRYSTLGEFSILLNTILWGFIVFLILSSVAKKKI